VKKFLILLILVMVFAPIKVEALNVTSEAIVVMDMNTKRIFYEKNKDKQRLVASISKIMTALLAIESNRLDEVVVVDESILKSYGSGIYIQIGEELTLRDLVYGLMLRSGNDAALMIANFISGSEEEFAKKMNEKAKEIGMKNSLFNNSSGLDNIKGNYSTAYDMALLTSYVMEYEEYRNIVKTKKYTLKTNYKTYIWYNKNKLLDLDYITGGKTGFTEKARRTLVSTGRVSDIDVVVVTLNDGNDWQTHKNMYDYVLENYGNYLIYEKDNFDIKDDTYYKGEFYLDKDIYVPLRNYEEESISSKIKLEKLKNYKSGTVIGTVEIYLKDKLLTSEEIKIKVSKEEKPYKKNIFERFIDWIKSW